MCVVTPDVLAGAQKSRVLDVQRPAQEVVVTFAVVAATGAGDSLVLLGASNELGAWCPDRGIQLKTSPESFPVWTVTLRLPASAAALAAYKFAVAHPCGGLTWEKGADRTLPLSSDAWMVAHFGKEDAVACGTHPRPARPLAGPDRVVLWEATCSATCPGDSLCVVGSSEELGGWDPARGVQLSTGAASFPQWHGAARLVHSEATVAWKFVIVRADGSAVWEQGGDRCIALREGQEGQRALFFRASFGSTGGEAEAPAPTPVAEEALDGVAVREGSPGSSCRLSSWFLEDDDASTDLSVGVSFSRLSTVDYEFSDQAAEPAGQQLWAGGHKVAKSYGHCEDSFFVGPNSLGVADGVGSMAYFESFGVSAAAYAEELMELAAAALRPGGTATIQGSAEARAAEAVSVAERTGKTFGAATIAVLEFAGGVAGVANLGDSGFMLIRGAGPPRSPRAAAGAQRHCLEIVTRSSEQQHGWNWPYQLMRLPEALASSVDLTRVDTAADCECYQFCVYPGDLILLYTDGFSDNLYEHEILEVIEAELSRPPAGGAGSPLASPGLPNPKRLARALAAAARERSQDPTACVPFGDTAVQFGQRKLTGGKVDDITVVAAWVVPQA